MTPASNPSSPRRRRQGTRASPARRLAHKVLLRVQREDAYAERVLDTLLARAELDPRERAFTTELVYGTLRHQALLDFYLARLATKPLRKLPPDVLVALELGAYQLLYTRVPAHSAVNESVALAAETRRSLRGVANGIMRALERQQQTGALPSPNAAFQDPLRALAVATNHPQWLLQELAAAWKWEDVVAFATANNAPPPLCLRVNPRRATAGRVAAALGDHGVSVWRPEAPLASALPQALATRAGGSVRDWPGFGEGEFSVQDFGAQLVGELTADAVHTSGAAHILDVCAAPGGKTTQLAEALDGAQRVLAVDVHPGRVRLIDSGVARLGLDAAVQTAAVDATNAQGLRQLVRDATARACVGTVLLDAPCSGLGTLRRHPELRHRSAASIDALVALQDQLLDVAAALCAPGGRLVYAVCTVTRAEGPERVRSFLARHPEFECAAPTAAALQPFLTPLDSGRALQVWPHRHGTDGFFAVTLRKCGESSPEAI